MVTRTFVFDADVAGQCQAWCDEARVAVHDLLAKVQADLPTLPVPSPFPSGSMLTEQFTDMGDTAKKVLGNQYPNLAALGEKYVQAGKAYSAAEEESKSFFANLTSESLTLSGDSPLSSSKPGTSLPTYSAATSAEDGLKTDFTGHNALHAEPDTLPSSELLGILENPYSQQWNALWDLSQQAGQAVSAYAKAGDLFKWASTQLTRVNNTWLHQLSTLSSTDWSGTGAKHALDATGTYRTDLAKLSRAMEVAGTGLQYFADALSDTNKTVEDALNGRPTPYQQGDSTTFTVETTPGTSITAGDYQVTVVGNSITAAQATQLNNAALAKARSAMSTYYTTPVQQVAKQIPVMPQPVSFTGSTATKPTVPSTGNDDVPNTGTDDVPNTGTTSALTSLVGTTDGTTAAQSTTSLVGQTTDGTGTSDGTDGGTDTGSGASTGTTDSTTSGDTAAGDTDDDSTTADTGSTTSSDPLSSLGQMASTAASVGQAGQSAVQAAQAGLAPLTAANTAKTLADALKPDRMTGAGKLGAAGGGGGLGDDDIASPRGLFDQPSKALFPRASLAAVEEAEGSVLGRAGMATGAGSPGSPGVGGGAAGNREKERKRLEALKSAEHIAEAMGDPMSITKPVVDQ